MSDSSQVEQPNQAGFEAYMQRAGEGPVVMLNLMEFKPDGGAERYLEYGAAVMPILKRIGARIVLQGPISPVMIGDGSWDYMVAAEYPTRQAFLGMIGSPEYRAIMHLRTEALVRAELHPMDPAELAI